MALLGSASRWLARHACLALLAPLVPAGCEPPAEPSEVRQLRPLPADVATLGETPGSPTSSATRERR